MNSTLDYLIPEGLPFVLHNDEGPDDFPAHVKSSLMGVSLNIPISNRKLALGTWQGVYLVEARNHGGSRRIVVTVWGE
jgi:secondary thiamine-phosphate synthase enzyme